ncbi:OLC1v1018564C1 [Oldenlandia corymbosa var. corymbosa]|uniref:OLC1v1018564C1 n=1 Tax=Oldenlandia corymbosa var. corymbosa TaxID=529605 RepID=A0AAV1EC07_OLDCO|nr:OLC1v1018564C1 [Oldenlandia corymbosa var. corymbosa]
MTKHSAFGDDSEEEAIEIEETPKRHEEVRILEKKRPRSDKQASSSNSHDRQRTTQMMHPLTFKKQRAESEPTPGSNLPPRGGRHLADRLLREMYEDKGRVTSTSESIQSRQAWISFNPPTVDCPDIQPLKQPQIEECMEQASSQEERAIDRALKLKQVENSLQKHSYLHLKTFADGLNAVMGPALEIGMRNMSKDIKESMKKEEDLCPLLDKYADEANKGQTSSIRLRFMARELFRDIDWEDVPIIQDISKGCPSITSPEDILNIKQGPSKIFSILKGARTPRRMPQGPDDEEEEKGEEEAEGGKESLNPGPGKVRALRVTNRLWILTLPVVTQGESQGDLGADNLCTLLVFKVFVIFRPLGEGGESPRTIKKPSFQTKEDPSAAMGFLANIPHVSLSLPDPPYDSAMYPHHTAIGKVLFNPSLNLKEGRFPELEEKLKNALASMRESEQASAFGAAKKLQAENERLRHLHKELEAYWEDHFKNVVQVEFRASDRLWKLEATIRKKKRNEGVINPDPEDFIPRNYY